MFKMAKADFMITNSKTYTPEDITLLKVYRMQGDYNSSDSSILYLIEAGDGLVGYSTGTYGVYTNHDEIYNDIIKRLKNGYCDDRCVFNENGTQQDLIN